MENPLLDRWMHLGGGEKNWDINRFMSQIEGRNSLAPEYAWAVPTLGAIERIVEWSPLIEVGAGRGYWAKLITDAGGDIVAYDISPPMKSGWNPWHKEEGLFFDVQVGGPWMLDLHPDRTLFLCWPPYRSGMATECLNWKPLKVIYIGEGLGGCTGSVNFHKRLAEEYLRVDTVDIPQWEGLHDDMTFWERR